MFFLYSPRVDQNRIVTITKALVITQERKTPAYYLYQQTQAAEAQIAAPQTVTTYLSNQNYKSPETALAVNEMKVERKEIASEVDAGFSTKLIENVKTNFNLSPMNYAQTDEAQPSDKKNETPNSSSANSPARQNQKQNNQLQNNQNPSIAPNRWATLRGKFEMLGVGVINDHVIELKRVEEGQVRELGRIDLKAGLYSIDIESPRGELVAEIRDHNGNLIGIDHQKITNLQTRGAYLEGPFIQVKHPATVSMNLALPSAASRRTATLNQNSHEKTSAFVTTLFSEQNILEKPTDEFVNIARSSSTVSSIADTYHKHRRIISMRQAGDDTETPLFTEAWIIGALDYISDQQKIEFKSKKAPVLIGRVMIDNKPLSSAQVQIENHPGIEPIYLDQFMIPNAQLTETSENGYFMFVGLEEENYSVTAFKQNKIIGHQMFIAETEAIAYQNILTKTSASSVVVRSFDAFTGDAVDIDLISPDLEEVVQTISGVANYRTQNNLGVSQFLVRTNAPAYLPVRYVQDSRKDYVHIPMIQENWLKQIQSVKLINELPDTGTIIGFVPEIDFEVYLISEGYSQDQVVYFDQMGRITQTPTKGGGFILFNVPVSAHEVVVQEKGSERIYSQVFDIKANQVSVSHFVD